MPSDDVRSISSQMGLILRLLFYCDLSKVHFQGKGFRKILGIHVLNDSGVEDSPSEQ